MIENIKKIELPINLKKLNIALIGHVGAGKTSFANTIKHIISEKNQFDRSSGANHN